MKGNHAEYSCLFRTHESKAIFHPAPFDFSHLVAGEPTISSEIRERYSINPFK